MKLVIQIPCFNEEKTLPVTFGDLPKQIEGVDEIIVQIINDGSTDRTVEVARELGIDHVISFKRNLGLAKAFKAGIDHALLIGADIVVNTDGDNQYAGQDIPELVAPILRGEADIVVGCRPIDDHPEFSFIKKKLQKFGSWVIRKISKSNVRDAASGFRAYSRNAMKHLNIFTDFSYTLETLIQSGYNNLTVSSVDINVNRKTRKSRLFRSIPHYLWKSSSTIIRVLMVYRASWFFSAIALVLFLCSLIPFIRYLLITDFFRNAHGDFWPSIIVGAAFFILSVQVVLTGVICSLLGTNRKLSEDVLARVREIEYQITLKDNPE